MSSLKLRIFALAVPALLALWAPLALGESFPSRPLTMYVGYPPGGTADRTARVLAQMMGRELKQSVVVQNKSGAEQEIAANAVFQAPADGYSILAVAEVDFLSKVSLDKNLKFKLADFTSVCGTATTPYVGAVVRADSRWKTIDDLVAELKAKPNSLSWGTAGEDTGHYWTMEMFQREAGVKVLHIPYRGGGPAITALLGGQIDLMGGTYALWSPLLKAGKVRALIIQGAEKIKSLPGVPTYADKGWFPGLKLGWQRLLVRKGTPAPVLHKLVKACEALKTDAHAQDILRAGGADPVYLGPMEATKQAAEDEKIISALAAGRTK